MASSKVFWDDEDYNNTNKGFYNISNVILFTFQGSKVQ